MRHIFLVLGLILIVAILSIGCSEGSGPVGITYEDEPVRIGSTGEHSCWGMWQFLVDPVAGNLDVVQLRGTDMHLNALVFLEPPAFVNLTLESPLEFNGDILEVDIGLRHPSLRTE